MNKTYAKPVVLANEEISEGVYTASGSGDCWTIDVKSVQTWDGSAHVFEVKLVHTTAVQHISTAQTVTLTFNYPLSSSSYAESNFACTVSGSTITITRNLHANGYGSGDTATFKVFAISTGDQAITEALAVTNKTVTCTKTANVQGVLD